MSFSITGNLFTGSFLRPDITNPNDLRITKTKNITTYRLAVSENESDESITVINEPKRTRQNTLTYSELRINWLNICGIIPGLSTVTGTGRALLRIVHTIAHLAKAIFDKQNRNSHLNEATLGFYNFARGTIEAVSFFGNTIVGIFDIYRLRKKEKVYNDEMEIQITQ
ncbi:hypothetical protein [Candidatus Protochlamydia sp. W-9]|uniref:hypothetical protein n=1 Tax=Candidatus Protochlamydia sp. W-9 TaxID=1785087 RepID=UPI00096A5DD3|nr:hypothetical protein [Candidatus Protochlamydia sp. W-9]